MPQLHLYLPEELAQEVRRRAEVRHLGVSAYLAALVRAQLSAGWPEGYFDKVVGAWVGDLERPAQGTLEDREAW